MYDDPVGSIDQEDVQGLMKVQKYKLGKYVFCFDKITGRYCVNFGITGWHYFSESELIEMGATPLIEKEAEMLEENIVAIRMSLTTSGAGLGEVSCELLAEQLVKINKAINALQKGVK